MPRLLSFVQWKVGRRTFISSCLFGLGKAGYQPSFARVARDPVLGRAPLDFGTSNPPCDGWTEGPGWERLTGVVLDRLTEYVHVLKPSGESYRRNARGTGVPWGIEMPAEQA